MVPEQVATDQCIQRSYIDTLDVFKYPSNFYQLPQDYPVNYRSESKHVSVHSFHKLSM